MRNIIGSWAGGEDFFGRKRELKSFRTALDMQANLLLVSPRRVGKTSFVIRLCEICRSEGWTAVWFNVESCSDEIAFVEALTDALKKEGLEAGFWQKIKSGLGEVRKQVESVGVAGYSLKMASSQASLYDLLKSILQKIEESGQRVLIAIDELPELLLALSKKENGQTRAEELLHLLRDFRQTYQRIQWIFLGSIGLNTFVETRNLGKTINDLQVNSLDAFTVDEAHRVLEKLGNDNRLPLQHEVRQRILSLIGWPLPYHLQLMFHAIKELDISATDVAAVEAAYLNLLQPANYSYFDTWRQRLSEQFETADASAAKAILKHLCIHPQGRTRSEILDALMLQQPGADAAKVEDQLADLLAALQRDGYLLSKDNAYVFRSFLLRAYWERREVR